MIYQSTNGGLNTSELIPQNHQNPPLVACKCVDSPVCPGPEAREQQKQLVYQAVKEGKLFLRAISLNSEIEYLRTGNAGASVQVLILGRHDDVGYLYENKCSTTHSRASGTESKYKALHRQLFHDGLAT